MQMAESCAHIKTINKKAKEIKQKDFEENMATEPESKIKLATKYGDVKALTKVQLCDLLFYEYQTIENIQWNQDCLG